MPRSSMLQDISYILQSGIKVALMYGDRDYASSWIRHAHAQICHIDYWQPSNRSVMNDHLCLSITSRVGNSKAPNTPLLPSVMCTVGVKYANTEICLSRGSTPWAMKVFNVNLVLMLILAYCFIVVPSCQPKTAYKIFMRAMFNRDIAT